MLSLILFCSIPIHMFIALAIESWAGAKALSAKKKMHKDEKNSRRAQWRPIRALHFVNILCCATISSVGVYNLIFHPTLGMICEMHAGKSTNLTKSW